MTADDISAGDTFCLSGRRNPLHIDPYITRHHYTTRHAALNNSPRPSLSSPSSSSSRYTFRRETHTQWDGDIIYTEVNSYIIFTHLQTQTHTPMGSYIPFVLIQLQCNTFSAVLIKKFTTICIIPQVMLQVQGEMYCPPHVICRQSTHTKHRRVKKHTVQRIIINGVQAACVNKWKTKYDTKQSKSMHQRREWTVTLRNHISVTWFSASEILCMYL